VPASSESKVRLCVKIENVAVEDSGFSLCMNPTALRNGEGRKFAMLPQPSYEELMLRMARFREKMDATYPDWDTAAVMSNLNQYYFASTISDGLLLIRSDGSYSYNVRTSYERAKDESPLENIHPYRSLREIADREGADLGNLYVEEESVPYASISRLERYFKFRSLASMESAVRSVRAIKSPYEMEWVRESGKAHEIFLTQKVPEILREGMSEAEFFAEAFSAMISLGYQGVSRFSKIGTEMQFGQFGFGENTLYPTSFDGPNGMKAYSAGVPLGGDRERRLKKGDMVFVDIAFGINAYHTDKSQAYSFGAKPPEEAVRTHSLCRRVIARLQEMLVPGAIPEEIYQQALSEVPDGDKWGFMGYENRSVKFLGHSVGLAIDEVPVIAQGFKDPLSEGMIIACEPKKGLRGIGMVGCEETFAVKPEIAECLTGGSRDIIIV